MFKSVIKEFIILLIMSVIISLILVIVLYGYNPFSKTIPNKVKAYSLPEEVETKLETTLSEEKIIKTYQIDGTDLSKYEKQDDYNPGKIEPYSIDKSTMQEEKPTENNVIEDPKETNTSGGIFFNIVGK